jgi:hypothetical protein
MKNKALTAFRTAAGVPTLLLVQLLAGCSDSTGGSTPTSEITPSFSISGTPNRITFVVGRLSTDGFASIRLPDNDAITVTASGQEKLMRWTVDPLGGGFYTSSLTELAPESEIVISLARGDGGNAPVSSVTMPPPVAITAPAAGASKLAGETLLVTWTPSGTSDQVQILMRSVVCSRPGAGTTTTTAVVGDPGSASVLIDPDLLPALASGESCDVDVQVQRLRLGTVDPAYATGGSIVARQLDAVRIEVLQP